MYNTSRNNKRYLENKKEQTGIRLIVGIYQSSFIIKNGVEQPKCWTRFAKVMMMMHTVGSSRMVDGSVVAAEEA